MILNKILPRAAARLTVIFGALALLASGAAGAQEGPAKRLASIVGVAVEEYGKGIDAHGRMISDQEYDEAVSFLRDARDVAARLGGARAASARAVLDTIVAAVAAKRPPAELDAIHKRFANALGAEGALDLPTRPIDLAAGRQLYEQRCASCHGMTGLGDGPQARSIDPAPPALGTRDAMHDVTPALMYRIVSVGIAGTPMTGWANVMTPDERWSVVSYVNSLRATRGQVAQGEGLYAQRCAACHGMSGLGDGTRGASLSKLPPEIASFAWQAERSDSQLATVVRQGIAGTAMPPSRELDTTAVASVVAYLRTLALRDQPTRAVVAGAANADSTGRRVLSLLDDALAAARDGRRSDAGDRAFDAYLAFEPLETPARARNPGLVSSMERHFADFKGAVKSGDMRAAERARDAVGAGMSGVVELTRPSPGGWGAFFESLLIILREGFEAILVIGAVVAFLVKTGHRDRLRSIWLGVALAVVASLATAVVLATTLRALPATRELIEGATMLIAVAVLFSVSYWLISKVEAAKWQQFIREKVTAALEHGGGRALAIVAFLAVYREGAETALFYQALFNDGSNTVFPIVMGIVVGFAALAVIFVGFHRFGVKLPLRPFFAVTSALLYYMAFVFMGKGIRELQEGNLIPITVIPFPSVEAMGIFPSVETLLAQLVLVVLFVFALLKTFWPKRAVTLPTAPPTASAASVAEAERVDDLAAQVRALEARLAQVEEAIPDVALKRD
jgi:high-affinity iron transporter